MELYLLIGMIYVAVSLIVKILYRALDKDYIYNEHPTPLWVVVIMNVLLMFTYPLFTLLFIISNINLTQRQRHIDIELNKIIKEMERWKKESEQL